MRRIVRRIPVHTARLAKSEIAGHVQRGEVVANRVPDGRRKGGASVAIAEAHNVGNNTEVDDAGRTAEAIDLARGNDRHIVVAGSQRSRRHEMRIRQLTLYFRRRTPRAPPGEGTHTAMTGLRCPRFTEDSATYAQPREWQA